MIVTARAATRPKNHTGSGFPPEKPDPVWFSVRNFCDPARDDGDTLRLRGRWRATGATASAAAPEVRLQQVRQRVDVLQLAVLDAEQWLSGAPLPPLALPAPNVQNTCTDPIVSSTMKRRLAMFTPLGTPTSQLSVGDPLPVCAPPSVRLQG